MAKTRVPYAPEFRRQMVDLVRTGRDPDDDFGSQAEAQRFFLENGGPVSDPHRLDERDNDGIAYESR